VVVLGQRQAGTAGYVCWRFVEGVLATGFLAFAPGRARGFVRKTGDEEKGRFG